ncbi:208aa long hypothetical transcription initiation factor IIB [Pyrococcus horikoshii OT3]|uniref:Transcription initiation factor IIB n=2 Tax=Pyrococcus horikoshii TaxID=53953 RepID=O58594_PYRHO|nr:208aa long hypothetical transcription initiation factor IIB [Pyrococcus horikoshii OT3]
MVREKIHRLKRLDSFGNKTEKLGVEEISRISSQLCLPKHVEREAVRIYRKLIKSGVTKGRSIESVAAACIYISCRLYKVPRTLDEIAKVAKEDKKVIARVYRLVVKKLGLSSKDMLIRPEYYIDKFADELEVSERVKRRALRLLNEAKDKGITSGKNPLGLAASILYIASLLEGERRTQKEIARVAGITEVTIRNRYKELVKELRIRV